MVSRWSRPEKTPAACADAGHAVWRQRLQPDVQQAVAGLAFDRLSGPACSASASPSRPRNRPKACVVELAQLRQAQIGRPVARRRRAASTWRDSSAVAAPSSARSASLRSRTLGSGPRGWPRRTRAGAGDLQRRRVGPGRAGGNVSLPAPGSTRKCRAGLSAKAARARRCASSSLAQRQTSRPARAEVGRAVAAPAAPFVHRRDRRQQLRDGGARPSRAAARPAAARGRRDRNQLRRPFQRSRHAPAAPCLVGLVALVTGGGVARLAFGEPQQTGSMREAAHA
jgi:hypothetical protein